MRLAISSFPPFLACQSDNSLCTSKFQFMLLRYPFDCGTAVGYIGCISIQTSTTCYGSVIYVCILGSAIGFCLFAIALSSDLKFQLNDMNSDLVAYKRKKLNYREHSKMIQRLNEFMEFHSETRELSTHDCSN